MEQKENKTMERHDEERYILKGSDAFGNKVEHSILPREKVEEIVRDLIYEHWREIVSTAWGAQNNGTTGKAVLDLEDGKLYSAQYIGNSQDIDATYQIDILSFSGNDSFGEFFQPSYEGEEWRDYTFEEQVDYLCEFFDDMQVLDNALDAISNVYEPDEEVE